jgi:hypothetical protein
MRWRSYLIVEPGVADRGHLDKRRVERLDETQGHDARVFTST